MKREHGPGAIMNGSGSHHTWGVLGYWLSARIRFFNLLGWSPVMHNPDSWEGWYWGAAHHWGQSARNGDRGAVICAVQLTERVPAGIVHSYESSALYEPIGEPGHSPDRGGCMNVLTPSRMMIRRSHALAANSCLVEIEAWRDGDA